jgi:aspartate kinase
VAGAHTLSELTYEEAEELAYYGADVLHPKTVRPVHEAGIPLRILNSFNPTHPGTLIVKEPSATRRDAAAIISTEGLSLVIVAGGDNWSPLTAARALQRLADAGVEVLMFSQSFSERSLSLVLRRDDQEHGLRVLGREFETDLKLGAVTRLAAQQQVATVSVVGMPGQEQVATLPKAFAALGRHGTRVILVAQAASEYNVTFVVPECDVEGVVQFIHRELALGQNGAA